MNYTEIVDLALSYSDREDIEVANRMDNFLRMVESRVNRVLKTGRMTNRATIPTVEDQEYYGLPADFLGMRDIEIRTSANSRDRVTLQYRSPEQMNDDARYSSTSPSYTIIAQQLQIFPPQADKLLEIVYHQFVPKLTPEAPSNWLSEINPDAYVFGLLVEINSFVKDAETATLWDARFNGTMKEIESEDRKSRWSGTALTTRVG